MYAGKPAARRADMSHRTLSTPKATRNIAPDHFVPIHSPSEIPATQRHGRSPSHGPLGPKRATTSPTGTAPTLRARTAREASRSMSTAAKEVRPKNMTNRSSSPVREWTMW